MKKHWLLTTLVALALCVICFVLFPAEAKAASVDDLTFTLNEDGQSYTVSSCSKSASGDLQIPETYNGKPVTGIEKFAFYYRKSLTSITIPDTVTSIGRGAFYGCKKLTSIVIPDGVSSIAASLFCNCSRLTSITIPASVTSFGGNSFNNCARLANVYYAGTRSEWINIKKHDHFDLNYSPVIHYSHVHDYSFYPPTKVEATCTEKGYTEYTCVYGEKYRTDYVPAQGHTNGANTILVAPTCDADGYTESSCSCCGKTFKTYTAAKLGHDFSGMKTFVAPTCTEDGYSEIQCIRCTETNKTDYVNALGHLMIFEAEVVATCTTDGHTEGTLCSRCGLLGTATKLEKGHSYKAATCTTPKTCKDCGATSGKKLGHTYTNNCDTTCNRCSAKRSITHSYKTTTTKATLSKNGSIVKKCTVCGREASKTTIRYVKSIKLSATSYVYNGKVKTPTVTVKDSAGKTLKKGTDYDVTYASGRKNAGTYKVTIKLKGNYSGTKTLTFKILPAAKVATQPKTQKVESGEKIKFTVKATGASLKYQWQYSTNGKTWKNASSTSAKKATFSFTGKTAYSGYYYRCKVTDNAGNVVYTDTVRLYVLSITEQPVSKTVTKGKTAKFTVEATGASKVYQWQYSTDGGKTWKNITSTASAKKATLSFTTKTSHNGNYYRCRIKDSGGNTIYTNKVKLTVK